MRACRFIVTNRFMHGMLHISSMLSEGILCYGLLLLLLLLSFYSAVNYNKIWLLLHNYSRTQKSYALKAISKSC